MILDQSATTKVVFLKLRGLRPGEENETLCSFSVEQTEGMPMDMVDCATIQFDKELMDLMNTVVKQKWFMTKFQGSIPLKDMVTDLERIAQDANEQRDRLMKHEHVIAHAESITDRTGMIVDQITKVGWENIHDIADNMDSMVMKAKDSQGREHRFSVNMDSSFPKSMPLVNADLPEPINLNWVEGMSDMNLSVVLEKAQEQITKYTPLFDVLSDIDSNCVVLEPMKLCFAATSRRIVIEKTCSLLLNINPDSPLALCEMHFMGPPAKVRALQKRMSENLHLWGTGNSGKLLRGRLEALLGVSLPAPSCSGDGDRKRARIDPEDEEQALECGICYNFALREKDGEDEGVAVAPDQICSKDSCQRMYHYQCLHDWLTTIPSSRTSFGSLFGHCPYCSEWLSMNIRTRT